MPISSLKILDTFWFKVNDDSSYDNAIDSSNPFRTPSLPINRLIESDNVYVRIFCTAAQSKKRSLLSMFNARGFYCYYTPPASIAVHVLRSSTSVHHEATLDGLVNRLYTMTSLMLWKRRLLSRRIVGYFKSINLNLNQFLILWISFVLPIYITFHSAQLVVRL